MELESSLLHVVESSLLHIVPAICTWRFLRRCLSFVNWLSCSWLLMFGAKFLSCLRCSLMSIRLTSCSLSFDHCLFLWDNFTFVTFAFCWDFYVIVNLEFLCSVIKLMTVKSNLLLSSYSYTVYSHLPVDMEVFSVCGSTGDASYILVTFLLLLRSSWRWKIFTDLLHEGTFPRTTDQMTLSCRLILAICAWESSSAMWKNSANAFSVFLKMSSPVVTNFNPTTRHVIVSLAWLLNSLTWRLMATGSCRLFMSLPVRKIFKNETSAWTF